MKSFRSAAKLSGSARARYLDRLTVEDADLRREVEELLAQSDRSSAFLGFLTAGNAKSLGHYKIHERIGDGGMGLVYKAEDTRLRRTVAIKALPPWAAGNQILRERLLEEARCASALNHPNIVTIYEILHEVDSDYIVMEYLSGKTLKETTPSKGLPVDQVIRYALAIADALDHAHARGILHRDLKPSNIFVSDGGLVKLLDFGLAVSNAKAVPSAEPHKDVWGTYAYMAPEQRQGGTADVRAEVFSFGIVLSEMFTGQTAVKKQAPEAISRHLSSKIPLNIQPVVRSCLAVDLAERFQTMRDVREALIEACKHNEFSVGQANASPARPIRAAEYQKAKRLNAQITYESFPQSRQASDELMALLRPGSSESTRSIVMSEMRDTFLKVPRNSTGSVSPPIREIRKLILGILRRASDDDLRLCFRLTDLEYLDLWDMNFKELDLSGYSFAHCFLTQSSFENCELTGAQFTHSRMRNVKFSGAVLTDADLTGADWFNALGLTEGQLRSVRTETLMHCPATEVGMREHLDNCYAFPMASWADPVREQLIATWKEYLCPGGLRDFARSLRGAAE